MSKPSASKFLEFAAKRRSVYTIDDEGQSPSVQQLENIIKRSLEISPSPWNIKSSCCVLIFEKQHKDLFNNIIAPAVKSTLPSDAFEKMKSKIEGLSAGLGTVLFFENQEVWDKLVDKSPRTKPMAGPWSDVVTGMLQVTVWTALANEGLGCSLQHYDWNETIVNQIHAKYAVPSSWRLKAQLVFGHKYEEPGPVELEPFQSLKEAFKSFH